MFERESERKELLPSLSGKIVTFIGPEGSGKSTNARLLSRKTGHPLLSTGDTLRCLSENDLGAWGNAARDMFAGRDYLDGHLMLEILDSMISPEIYKNGFVLDGGLRTIEETLDFPKMLENADRKLPMRVILLNVSEEVALQRLCFSENARKRDDDSIEGIMSRLDKFYKGLPERLEFIKKQNDWKLLKINAEPSKDKVFNSIREALLNDDI